jgi:hypothetical protein
MQTWTYQEMEEIEACIDTQIEVLTSQIEQKEMYAIDITKDVRTVGRLVIIRAKIRDQITETKEKVI